MGPLLDDLRETVERLRALASGGLRDGFIRRAADASLIDEIAFAGEALRLVEALLVESAGEVIRRSSSPLRDERLTTRMGCHDVSELLQRLTRVAPASAARLQRGARAVLVEQRLDGEPLPARLPAMREALIDGEVGLDGLLAVAGPLEAMGERVPTSDLLAADAVLAAEAKGEGPDAAPPACADLLRVQALAWSAALDQDGAEPREERALARRGIRLGRVRDGVVPISGALLPEVAAQLQRICDAIDSPRSQGPGVAFRADADPGIGPFLPDARTRSQRHHDMLATALSVAASSRLLPTIGGAPPTLVVSVRAEDVIAGSGWAHVEGVDEPVSTAAARHAGCAGVIQRVLLGENGRIVRIGTEERLFNKNQRRAIALRDGNCIIPGCGIPAAWCEIHHVIDHAHGGPTHTDNGVLLCWHHHRFIDDGLWKIRMNRGVPEVQAPKWYDATLRWRPVTTSRSRLLDRVRRRT
ncbi:HNH endonuclease signature motif containing protein [Microbacterium sp. BK668]|uniref:HNH endonuclease signature motif containing protein n=1 Tax=Microbacterium sp. BK668 TaxID=2512118 RepID=UPI00105BF4BA|nr:HNH endonuclease signature motif containing protein [Microbacterium sp. BK668]TDN92831.1 uncharacterized protein DUF222 [Microbacterium sp. BK668]